METSTIQMMGFGLCVLCTPYAIYSYYKLVKIKKGTDNHPNTNKQFLQRQKALARKGGK